MKATIPNSNSLPISTTISTPVARRLRLKVRSSLKPLRSIASTPSLKKTNLAVIPLKPRKITTA